MKNKYGNIVLVLLIVLINFTLGCFEETAFDITKEENKKICGDVGNWAFTASFATGRSSHTSVVYNGYMYVIGGGGWLNDVQYAPINADGTIGSWTATTSFISERNGHTSVVYNGYLYVIGGWTSPGVLQNDVQYAKINSDGTVGSWTATTSFTTGREWHTSAVYNGYMYVIGGTGFTHYNDVQYAKINSDGTVGSWTDTTSFISARYNHTSVVYNGYLYVIGGTTGVPGVNYNGVQAAKINSDGTVGSWSATTSFTTVRRGHTSIVANGYMYVIGGDTDGGSMLNDVQYAPVNANGTIGSWTATRSFNTARLFHTSVVYNNYLYVIGGNGLNDVQYAKQCP